MKLPDAFCRYSHVFIVLALIPLLSGGCFFKLISPEKRSLSLVRLAPEDYPRFSDDLFFDGIDRAVFESLSYYNKLPRTRTFSLADDAYDVGHMIRSLEHLLAFLQSEPSANDLNAFIRDNYTVYRSTGKDRDDQVLFTGYYEPRLRGSLSPSDVYRYPVLSDPDDLMTIDLRLFSDDPSMRRTLIGRCTPEKKVVPYYDRRQIGTGDILMDRSRVLAWVDDRIDLFFLEIQGSGIIYLDNGGFIRVHYHTKNGHPYRSIGTHLIRTGRVAREEMSMQKIREYLTAHPDEVDEILNYNPSYVFFKTEEGGPYGCYGVAVTPERSIATDKRMFPACAMAFIESEKPLISGDGDIVEWRPFGRFVLNQDTGGAIRGPGRADLFTGNGHYAEVSAGHMQHTGRLYFLVLNRDRSGTP
ncbi:MltA domain-containing protein [Desulfatiferula olefinivorans]